MTYTVQLIYFRQTGKFLTIAETTSTRRGLVEIWEEIDDKRRLGQLPGLRPGAGRDLFIVIDVPDHPQRVPHMVMPPFLDEDDVTPTRGPRDVPLVRVPLEEMPRTTTRDILKIDPTVLEPRPDPFDTVIASDEEVTPPDQPIPTPPDDEPSG